MKPIINLMPVEHTNPAGDYMRYTMANNNYDQFSGTSYNDFSNRNLKPELTRSDFNTQRPQRTISKKEFHQMSSRPVENKLLNQPFDQMEIDQILKKNQEMTNMYRNGVSLYSVEPSTGGYQ